jgi:hypothetical protein
MNGNTTEAGWANYGTSVEVPGESRDSSDAKISVSGFRIQPQSLSVVDGRLVVAFGIGEITDTSFETGEPLVVSTHKETVRAKINEVAFDIDQVILSFERVGT